MSYVSHWLETALKNHPKTTLFFSAKQTNQMWINMSRACLVQDVKVPIDQEKFDHQPNRRMDAALLRAMRRFISESADEPVKSDLLKVLTTIEYLMLKSPRFVTVRGSRGDVPIASTKGLESGLRWTALFGTVMNYAELHTAKDIVEESQILSPFIDEVVQGDDDRLRCKNIAAASAIVGAYKSMDLKLNLKKFFTDFNRDEFLRQVAVWGDVSGYPARGVLGLLWRNPVSRDPIAGLLRAREQLKAWNLMLGRGTDRQKTMKHMYNDITAANGITNTVLRLILSTPASSGGFGFYPPGLLKEGKEFKVGQSNVKAKIVEDSIKGLDWNIAQLELLGMKVSKKEAIAHIIPNVEAIHAKKEIIAGEIVDVNIPKPVMWECSSAKGVPIVPRVNEEIPRTLAGLGLSKAKELRNWDWIQNVYINVDDRAISKRIHKRGGRRVWLDWIDNKLAFAAPVVPAWSETAISVEFNALVSSYWTRVVSYHRFTSTSILRAAIRLEQQVRSNLMNAIVHIGG
jgi:hypothetical protein